MRLHTHGAAALLLHAAGVLASLPQPLRRDGGDDGLAAADVCQGTQTVYTTVTVWSDASAGEYEPTGLPAGTDGERPDYGVGSGAYGGAGGGAYSGASGAAYSGADGGAYSGADGGAGGGEALETPVIGLPYGGHGPLKPSIIPTATYGPWAIVNGDVHDYSEHGSGPWAAPGYNPGGSGSGSGSGSGPRSSGSSGPKPSGSGSGSAASPSSGSGGATPSNGGGFSGSHGGNGTLSSSILSATHSGSAHTRPSSTASRSPLPPRPSHSGSCKPCAGNTASTRSQWCEYDLQTDYYETVPCTGVTREYTFELAEHIASPDGWPRLVQTINGQIPGPTIIADWGDEIVVHFKNSLPADSNNGSALHFHGIQQKNTNSADGVSSVTQCPVAPGESYTYRWTATQYGTSWYHSHFGFQAWNGLSGGILINGPASANYDVDVGTMSLSDWNHWTADMIYPLAQVVGPVTELTGLINGTNKWNTSISSEPTSPFAPPPVATNGTKFSNSTNGNLIGEYLSLKFEKGLSYRLRLVNVAIDSGFKFSIDNHTLTVIATDFVPIQPYQTDTLFVYMGQRYDVIVQADQTSATEYWMRAIPMAACSANSNQFGIKGIIRYGSSTAEPTTTAYTYVDECVDEPAASLVPVLAKTVGPADLQTTEAVSVAKNANNFFEWTLNGTSFLNPWNDPPLLNVYNNDSTSLKEEKNLIELPTRGEWFYLLITEVGLPVPHPIHLHGHDFYILGAGDGVYTGNEPVNTVNPPRRDVAGLPGGGWLLLGWKADNPGVWLMHCHIGWHTLEGFALQFLELEDEILTTGGVIDEDELTGTCNSWNSYVAQYGAVQGVDGVVDSGL